MFVTSIVILLVIIGLLSALVDLLVVGSGLTSGLLRWIRSKRNGSKVISLPPELAIAAMNGLIRTGSEVVSGYTHEWEGAEISRFAIPPEILGQELGTRMTVIRLEQNVLEVIPMCANGSDERRQIPEHRL